MSRRGGAVTARGRGARRGGRRIVRGGGGGAAMERWTGRVALVTGASVGIGAAVARALVQHGMKVVGCARSVDKIEVPGRGRGVRLREGRGGSLGPGGAIGGSAPSPQRLRARSGRAAPRGPACAGGTGRGGGSALGAVPRRGAARHGGHCGRPPPRTGFISRNDNTVPGNKSASHLTVSEDKNLVPNHNAVNPVLSSTPVLPRVK